MKNYSFGWRKFETEFDGHQVTCELKPLSLEAWLLLQPCLESVDDKLKLAATGVELLKISGDIFKGHVQNINGFLINEEQPTIAGIVGNMCFVLLVSTILVELIKTSMLDKEESKNSEGLSTSQHSKKLSLSS